MAWTTSFPVRFPDVDWARVVYFPRFLDYCHRAFEDFFGAQLNVSYADVLQQMKLGFPIVHADADFRSPLRFGDTARIVMEVVRISDRSISTRYRFFVGDGIDECACVTLVQASIDTATFKPTTIPAEVRRCFEQHLVETPK